MTGIENKISMSYLLVTPSPQTNINLNTTITFVGPAHKNLDPETIKKSTTVSVKIDVISTHNHLPKYIENMLKSIMMPDGFFKRHGGILFRTGLFAGAVVGSLYASHELGPIRKI